MGRFASVLAIAVPFTLQPLSAQLPAAASDMLRRLYASRDFALQPFGPARWRDGGAAYTTVEPSATTPGASDIVRYETATGAKRVMVTARQLVPASAATPLDIDDYDWSGDDSLLLVFTNTQRVWRRNTRGDYWAWSRRTGMLRKLGGPDAPESSWEIKRLEGFSELLMIRLARPGAGAVRTGLLGMFNIASDSQRTSILASAYDTSGNVAKLYEIAVRAGDDAAGCR